MLLRRIAIQNVRSFLERQELQVDGSIAILIGPNGGGKTNLLDAIIIMLRRYMLASTYAVREPTPENPNRYVIRANDALNQMILDRHSDGKDQPQIIEIEVEVSTRDIENMNSIKTDCDNIQEQLGTKYYGLDLLVAKGWDIDGLAVGSRLTFKLINGTLEVPSNKPAKDFLEYLRRFELDSRLRSELDMASLSMPVIYMPVARATQGLTTNIDLANYNDYEHKRTVDATLSKSGGSIFALAISRLALKYLTLLHQDKGGAKEAFRNDVGLAPS